MDQKSVSPIAMFLLAGQSNMSGRGEIVGDSVYDSRILQIAGGTWSVARHPLHADKPEKAGVGPGMSFARSIVAGLSVSLNMFQHVSTSNRRYKNNQSSQIISSSCPIEHMILQEN